MKLHLLEIPATTAELARWLEQQIMGPSFGELATQLQIVNASQSPQEERVGLSQIFGDAKSDVVENGLANCTSGQLQQMLANPESLLELQDKVFETGSQYWLQQVESPAIDPQNLRALKIGIENINRATSSSGASVTSRRQQTVAVSRRAFNWKMLVLAAGILLMAAVGWNLYSTPDQPALAQWGWLAEDALPQNVTPGEYLAEISAGGQAWFDKEIDSADQYIQRLRELQAGCELLINADHAALAAADQQWLIGNCMVWRDKFQEQLGAVSENPKEFKKYLNETNKTVNSLVNALDEKAKSV